MSSIDANNLSVIVSNEGSSSYESFQESSWRLVACYSARPHHALSKKEERGVNVRQQSHPITIEKSIRPETEAPRISMSSLFMLGIGHAV